MNKAIGLQERIYLRGIEGMISDKFLGEIVSSEWKDNAWADEAMRNQMEAKYMAEQVYAYAKGWTQK